MQKIKQFLGSEKGKDILVVFIVILVGLGSFELGRLSKQGSSGGIKIEYPSTATAQNMPGNALQALGVASSAEPQNTVEKAYFASNRGSKYYPVGCSAGKSIKLENRIYFKTNQEAERAGYELSNSCE